MQYTRDKPSPRYRELLDMYRQLHRDGDPDAGIPADEMFDGRSLPPHAPKIAQIIRETGAESLLDYGSGKGRQYGPFPLEFADGTRFDSIADWWAVHDITCYDPACPGHDTLPEGPFDGVVCTDVMEHCPEEDLPWITAEIFRLARKFVFLSVACYPAEKTLPNGENAHCTLKPQTWWLQLFRKASQDQKGLRCFVVFIDRVPNAAGQLETKETLFSSRT